MFFFYLCESVRFLMIGDGAHGDHGQFLARLLPRGGLGQKRILRHDRSLAEDLQRTFDFYSCFVSLGFRKPKRVIFKCRLVFSGMRSFQQHRTSRFVCFSAENAVTVQRSHGFSSIMPCKFAA